MEAQIFNGGALFCSSLYALGIEAASFASAVYGASKDIAESPTAEPERPKAIYNLQLTVNSCLDALIIPMKINNN